MRITYIIEGLSNSGGMERVVSLKASWLAENTSNDISIITFAQGAEKDFFPLSDKVNRVKWNLSGAKSFRDNLFRCLKDWLTENPQDICISTYGREFWILPDFNDGSKKIVEFHFAYDINKHWLASSGNQLKTLILGSIKTWRMAKQARKYNRIVCLTKADLKRWNTEKAIQIYNPITIPQTKTADCTSKVVVAMGRMDRQKGFDILLDCWKLIEDKYPEWLLKIYGGGDASPYEKQIEDLQLKRAHLLGRTADVPSVLRDGSIYVLSSRYEGFSLTICEAMSCGLPIVTFDCPSGPAELVKNGTNGYIINKVGDIHSMAEYLSQLMDDEKQRSVFGKESYKMSDNYSLDSVMEKWVFLFESMSKS